jgi:hypothetical protein
MVGINRNFPNAGAFGPSGLTPSTQPGQAQNTASSQTGSYNGKDVSTQESHFNAHGHPLQSRRRSSSNNTLSTPPRRPAKKRPSTNGINDDENSNSGGENATGGLDGSTLELTNASVALKEKEEQNKNSAGSNDNDGSVSTSATKNGVRGLKRRAKDDEDSAPSPSKSGGSPPSYDKAVSGSETPRLAQFTLPKRLPSNDKALPSKQSPMQRARELLKQKIAAEVSQRPSSSPIHGLASVPEIASAVRGPQGVKAAGKAAPLNEAAEKENRMFPLYVLGAMRQKWLSAKSSEIASVASAKGKIVAQMIARSSSLIRI